MFSPHTHPGIGPDPQNRAAVRPASSFPKFFGLFRNERRSCGCVHAPTFFSSPPSHPFIVAGFSFLTSSCSTWALTSSTENQTCAPSHGTEARHLSHCTTRQVPFLGFLPELQGVPQEAETWRVERRRRYGRILFYCTLKILHFFKKNKGLWTPCIVR